MSKRVWQYPEVTSIAADDYLLLDNETDGSKSILASKVGAILINKVVTERKVYKASDETGEVNGYKEVSVEVPYTTITDLEGDIVTFEDGEDLPMPSLKVGIEPIQSGSGDPSSTNIRPISGHTEVNVSVSGKNLLQNNSWYNFAYNASVGDTLDTSTSVSSWTTSDNETYTTTLTDWQRSGWLSTKLPQGTTVTSSVLFVSGNPRVTSYILDENFKITRSFGLANPISDNTQYGYTITLTNNECYFAIAIIGSNKTTVINKPIIEVGTTATTYEPYNGHTYTIDLDGTRYGGEVDVVNGTMTVDRVGVDLSSVSFTYDSNNKRWSRQFSDMKNYTARSADLMFEQYQATTSAYTGDTGTAFAYGKDIYIYDANQSLTISGKCVYELATPLTIQLTPTQVKSLLGSNNVWADCGKSLVSYQKTWTPPDFTPET